MVELAGEFKKSGFSDEDAKILAEVGAKYQNVADSEISAAESAGFITSQIRAFHLEAKDGIQVIDKVNEVSNNFSVSSTNIAQGMAKQSSAFASFGNDIDETIAMITAGTGLRSEPVWGWGLWENRTPVSSAEGTGLVQKALCVLQSELISCSAEPPGEGYV